MGKLNAKSQDNNKRAQVKSKSRVQSTFKSNKYKHRQFETNEEHGDY